MKEVGIGALLVEYGPPVSLAALVVLGLLGLFYVLSRVNIAPGLWRGVRTNLITTALLALTLLFGIGLATYFQSAARQDALRKREAANLLSPSNLLADPLLASVGPATSTLEMWTGDRSPRRMGSLEGNLIIEGQQAITSSVVIVQAGEEYRYSLYAWAADPSLNAPGTAQVRLLWLDRALGVLSWDDSPARTVGAGTRGGAADFYTAEYTAPKGARGVRLIIRNVGDAATAMVVDAPQLSQEGVYIETHPDGALGSLAFSFDWETAMGGAIHSKGMDPHDPAGAAQHGLDMREGTDWLAALFKSRNIQATFYGTGYNLLDGNTERRAFAGDPIYKWANKKDGWATDYWTTHKWYSDDPYSTAQSDPAWYFGDQSRSLLQAGHEIAPHTFGHLYVRGATVAQLGEDMDEWLKYAKQLDITPSTFAFPWRSSNSLTRDFYEALHRRGIGAVTRLYERDLRDLYTLGAAYGRSGGQPWIYEDISVMPDFLLGSPSAYVGEEAAGSALSSAEGLRVIGRTIESRGTTSLWQHPEQLAGASELAGVRSTWTEVVSQAARERDNGRLWIAPVASIVEYQRDVMSVTASLDSSFFGGWQLRVNNNSGQTLSGVTLTLPGDVRSATSGSLQVRAVSHAQDGKIQLSAPGEGAYPARQIVLDGLGPGTSTIDIRWAPGQEPLR